MHLTASPFYSYFSIALITSIITFVVLSSKYTSWIVKGVLGVLLSLGSSCLQAIQPSAAPVCLPVTSFVDLLKAYMDKVDLVQWVFKHIIWIDDTMVSPRLLSLAAFAGITAYVLWGMIAALLDKPTDWWNNVLMSFRAVLVSASRLAGQSVLQHCHALSSEAVEVSTYVGHKDMSCCRVLCLLWSFSKRSVSNHNRLCWWSPSLQAQCTPMCRKHETACLQPI